MLLRSMALKSMVLALAVTLAGVLSPASTAAAAGTASKSSKSSQSAKVVKPTKTVKTVKTAQVRKKDTAASTKTATRKASSQRSTAARSTKKVTVAQRKSASESNKLRLVKAAPSRSVIAKTASVKSGVVRVSTPPLPSVEQRMDLHSSPEALAFNSSVALVLDQQTNEVLFSKNDSAVLPIASLTKLMTGLVVAEAGLDMNEQITITADEIDTIKGSRSRLAVGSTLTRGELMHLALMSSENRAAHALGRTFPGGLAVFVQRMNQKAAQLGMADTRYVEPTGLSSDNRSSARDLATLVSAAYKVPMLRDLSTSPGYEVDLGRRTLQYNNSNRLIKNPDWDIGLQKTGYISEAGRCLVMQARVAGRQLIMVFLDASGQLGRIQDAERVRRWVELKGDMLASRQRPQG
jgi:D-alanyl-D-alanine endopeptidase (penicillin-binding protein 7)